MHLFPPGEVSGSAQENNESTKSRASSADSLPFPADAAAAPASLRAMASLLSALIRSIEPLSIREASSPSMAVLTELSSVPNSSGSPFTDMEFSS